MDSRRSSDILHPLTRYMDNHNNDNSNTVLACQEQIIHIKNCISPAPNIRSSPFSLTMNNRTPTAILASRPTTKPKTKGHIVCYLVSYNGENEKESSPWLPRHWNEPRRFLSFAVIWSQTEKLLLPTNTLQDVPCGGLTCLIVLKNGNDQSQQDAIQTKQTKCKTSGLS